MNATRATRRFARALLRNTDDADDAMSEVFAQMPATIQRANGPVDSFASYLMCCVRLHCYRATGRRARECVDERDRVGAMADAHAHQDDPAGRLAVVTLVPTTARAPLPPNLRHVLWWTEVDDVSLRDLANELEATPHAIAVTARARQALGGAYVSATSIGTPHPLIADDVALQADVDERPAPGDDRPPVSTSVHTEHTRAAATSPPSVQAGDRGTSDAGASGTLLGPPTATDDDDESSDDGENEHDAGIGASGDDPTS